MFQESWPGLLDQLDPNKNYFFSVHLICTYRAHFLYTQQLTLTQFDLNGRPFTSLDGVVYTEIEKIDYLFRFYHFTSTLILIHSILYQTVLFQIKISASVKMF